MEGEDTVETVIEGDGEGEADDSIGMFLMVLCFADRR